jgi:hypothetical protein
VTPSDKSKKDQLATFLADLDKKAGKEVAEPRSGRRRRSRERMWIGRRARFVGEWETRLTLLSNRLTRYAYAAGNMLPEDYDRLRLVEARLFEVIFAAGAIETSYFRIKPVTAGLAAMHLWQPVGDTGVFHMNHEVGDQRRFRRLVAIVPDAHYDFHAMLWWGRALLDGVEGGWGERVKGELVDQPTGLVHFLPRRDAARVRKARDGLLKGGFAGVRDLAGYSLHAFAVPNAASMMHMEPDGTHTLPLPDRLGRRPVVAEEFTFAEHRHIGAEVEHLWDGVIAFVSETLSILEDAQLRREEKLAGQRLKLVRLLRKELMPAQATGRAKRKA